MASVIRPELQAAAQALKAADGLLITTGAGMGVDSGLPDFRGSSGFWKSYPALKASGLRFQDIANPNAFEHHAREAWGFYGHRLNLYRSTEPHEGFFILKKLTFRCQLVILVELMVSVLLFGGQQQVIIQ